MNYLYHLSPEKNLISIKTQGLRINQKHVGVATTRNLKKEWTVKYGCIPIFLISDPGIVQDLMLTPDAIKEINWYVFKVEVNNLTLTCATYPGEFICTEDIEPNRIKDTKQLKDFKLERW
jgi:hypothetical protein